METAGGRLQVTYTGILRRAWNGLLQVLEENNCQHPLLYAAKLPLGTEGRIKTSHNNHELKEFIVIKCEPQTVETINTGIPIWDLEVKTRLDCFLAVANSPCW